MERTNFNIYLLKALDAYPYNLEEAIEALNYALSYDEKNVQALCLMGKIYAEQLGEYEAAKECFAEAMASKIEFPSIYPDYIAILILNGDLAEAQKLLEFALCIKGVDKASLYSLQSYLLEVLKQYKMAINALEEAKKYAYNANFMSYLEKEINRVKKKLPNGDKKNKKRKEDTSKNRSK